MGGDEPHADNVVKTNETEAPQIVGIVYDAVDPGTDVPVEVPALDKTWRLLL